MFAYSKTLYQNSLPDDLEVSVILDNAYKTGKISFLLDKEKALNLKKNQPLDFIGKIDRISPGFMNLKIILSDVVIR
ncbi:hypothetical protein ABFY09_12840 [Marinomonas sp. 5E14-1]|uniref:hypothetical protein n=1 Tax=Marinomonas sp. 5E14-1 TaxID=3153922 RepID=UPI0032655245